MPEFVGACLAGQVDASSVAAAAEVLAMSTLVLAGGTEAQAKVR